MSYQIDAVSQSDSDLEIVGQSQAGLKASVLNLFPESLTRENRWFDCALWYYSAITVKNETSDHEEHEYDLDLLQSEAIPCFKLANKPNYAAALRHLFKMMIC